MGAIKLKRSPDQHRPQPMRQGEKNEGGRMSFKIGELVGNAPGKTDATVA